MKFGYWAELPWVSSRDEDSKVSLNRCCTVAEEQSSSFYMMKPMALACYATVLTSGSVALRLPNIMLLLIVSLNRSGSYWTIEILSLRYGTSNFLRS